MSSIQDRLEQSSLKIRQKMFDNQIHLTGQSAKVIRIKPDKNDYGDDKGLKIISKDTIECIIHYPGDVPLSRNRTDNSFEQVSSTGIFLMDVLPIDLYTQWQDNVEKFDFIIHTIKDEQGNDIKFLLQVSEVVGSFKSSLLWKKSLCAPYNGVYTQEILNMITL